jgi:uncharacterized cupin superfamily protein
MIEIEKKVIHNWFTFYVIKGNSIYHREDGPAVEWFSGDKDWFFHGKSINCDSQEEFERQVKLLAFL